MAERLSANPSRAVRLTIWVGAAIAAVAWAAFVLRPSLHADTYAFSACYGAARLVIETPGHPDLYGEGLAETQRRAGLVTDRLGPFPPTLALVMVPIAWLPARVARPVWLSLDLLMLAAIVWLAGRLASARPDPLYWPAAIIVLSLHQPLAFEVANGQVYTLVALVYTVWLWAWLERRETLGGAALAALLLLKLSGWPLWVLAIWRRRFRVVAWGVAWALAAVVVSWPLLGLRAWRAFVTDALPSLAGNPAQASTAYQTLRSALGQMLDFDPRWSPAPLVDAPLAAAGVWIALATGLLWMTFRRTTPGGLREALATLCLVVPLQPAGGQHHYLILAAAWLAVLRTGGGLVFTRATRVMVVVALGLFALPPYFLAPDLTGWRWALVAYPRVAAALLLWAALVVGRRSPEHACA